MSAGVSVEVGSEAVVVTSREPLRVLSSAVHHGGFAEARAIVNLHVDKNDPCTDPADMIGAFARRAGVPAPWVGLLTGAHTERAVQAEEAAGGFHALAVVTVGLSNPVAAGSSPVATWAASTINTIVVVDANPEPAALVNAVITATDVKGLALQEAGCSPPVAGRERDVHRRGGDRGDRPRGRGALRRARQRDGLGGGAGGPRGARPGHRGLAGAPPVILRLGGVMLSVVLHVGLIALLLAWSATDWTRPVFVDLGERADSPGSPSADPSPARSTRPAARAAGAAPHRLAHRRSRAGRARGLQRAGSRPARLAAEPPPWFRGSVAPVVRRSRIPSSRSRSSAALVPPASRAVRFVRGIGPADGRSAPPARRGC